MGLHRLWVSVPNGGGGAASLRRGSSGLGNGLAPIVDSAPPRGG